MNVRLLPEQPEVKNQPWRGWVPNFLLALAH